jgi:quercetin dioxygenase-like cupin family protein
MLLLAAVALTPVLSACSDGGADPEGSAVQAAPAQDAPEAAVTQRIPQFENENVTVWKTIIAPHQPLNMHRHENGRVLVALKGGTLKIVPENGEPHEVTWETGNAYWLEADPPGELHGDVYEGEGSMEVMVIEMRPREP